MSSSSTSYIASLDKPPPVIQTKEWQIRNYSFVRSSYCVMIIKHKLSGYSFSFLLFCLILNQVHAQNFSGKITDQDGNPLPYATVLVVDEHRGTASNEEGFYQLSLTVGEHLIVFQYLGYETQRISVTMASSAQQLDVRMTPEVTTLSTIHVTTGDEDPAYTIMRKAIAKAKFHTQQLDGYQTQVYIKGSGRLKKVPWLFRKRIEREMKKEGIDTSTAFVSESVSQVSYQRPDHYEEKVISIRKIGEDNNTSPAEFIQTSFYAPEVNGAVSPLSPKAFSYYRFEYLGFITDGRHNVNKIKVTPRSRGDQVFEGVLYIVDDLWSIHSLDLFTYLWGIKFKINLIYTAIQDDVWLPVNQIYDVTGSVFGFGFEYQYLANLSDYQIELNPDLEWQPELIDGKLDPDAAKQADAGLKNKEPEEFMEAMQAGEEISPKQLRKALREYEKQELEAARSDTLEDVVAIRNHEIDSSAYDRDSMYWTAIRPIPLTQYEVKGYRVMDSMAIVYAEEEAEKVEDSLALTLSADGVSSNASEREKFTLSDFFFAGARFKLSDAVHLGYPGLLINTHFNTVEGYHLTWKPYLRSTKGKLRWRVGGELKYSFARDRILPAGSASLSWGKPGSLSTLQISGGIKVDQINRNNPIDPLINDLNSLLFERNYLKVLQRRGLELRMKRSIGSILSLEVYGSNFSYDALQNNTDQVIFGSRKRSYTSNAPMNFDFGITDFAPFELQTLGSRLSFRLKPKYRVVNGRKSEINRNSPSLHLQMSLHRMPESENQPNFQHVELQYQQKAKIGIRGDLGLDVRLGTFAGSPDIPFPAYKHFPGNRTFIHITDPLGSFRLLPYYELSTKSTYLQWHSSYQFRKFLLTQLPLARLAGVRENLFANLLSTGPNDYLEVGYGINYIFRFLRLEFIAAYDQFKFREFGLRLGLASNLEAIFD